LIVASAFFGSALSEAGLATAIFWTRTSGALDPAPADITGAPRTA
jgi:hypothetical protein